MQSAWLKVEVRDALANQQFELPWTERSLVLAGDS